MGSHLASAKINTALKRRTPTAADLVYQPGDLILVWRKKQIENRKGKLVSPCIAITVDPTHKIILIRKADYGPLKRYITAQVKPYRQRGRPRKEFTRDDTNKVCHQELAK